jgi:ADP-heptose:LPS heptosyltransferase
MVEPVNILIVKPDKLGDFILATPALFKINELAPDNWRITLAVGPEAGELATRLPLSAQWRVEVGGRKGKRLTFGPGQLHWYDRGVLLRYDADYYNAAEIVAEHCRESVTWSREVTPTKLERNPPAWEHFFTNCYKPTEPLAHEVVRNIQLAGGLLNVNLSYDLPLFLPTRREWLQQPRERLVIVPGAGEAKRMLSPDQWAFVGLRRWEPLWLGAPSELPLLEACAERCGGSVYAGDIMTALGFVHNAERVVTMDSGLSHAAAAYEKKHLCVNVVGLVPPESPNSVVRFGPWNKDSTVVQPQFLTSDNFVKWMEG